jgi:hypothetical protein
MLDDVEEGDEHPDILARHPHGRLTLRYSYAAMRMVVSVRDSGVEHGWGFAHHKHLSRLSM